jgi:hypothetical protein
MSGSGFESLQMVEGEEKMNETDEFVVFIFRVYFNLLVRRGLV